MCRHFRMLVLALLIILSFQQVSFAKEDLKRPPKPTEGIESSDPKHGSSIEISIKSIQGDLFYKYNCTIDNTGTELYIGGITSANYLADKVSLTLYLQKWNGLQWVDIQSWSFTEYNTKSIIEGEEISYEQGNYYRARATHSINFDSQTETQTSTSTYIYVE